MTGTIDTGIKLASGLATIKQSDITSTGPAGIGIHLVGGGDHEIGADGNTGVKNVFKLLATAIKHDANLHAKVYANDIGTADDGNSVGILSTTNANTNALTSKGNTYRSTPLAIDIDGDVDLTSNGDTFHDATTAAIDLNNAAATADVDNLTIENSCTIGILATRNSTINVADSTFNLAAGDTGLFADTTATGSSITMLNNKFLQNTEDADSELAIHNDSGSKITATYNWFSHATGPRHVGVDITDISGIQIDGLIEFSPFYDSVDLAEGGIDFRLKATDTSNAETYHTYLDTAQAVVNLSQLDIQRTFQLLNDIELTADNTNYICSNQQTILDPVGDNEVVLSGSGSTITNCKIDDNLKITGNSSGISGTTVTGNILLNGTNNFIMASSTIEGTTAINNTGADLKGSTFKGTVTISNSNAKIGKNGGNTFTMTGADTAITSPGTDNAFTGLEIIDNTFSGNGSYIGIDLKDDFGNPAQGDAQAITLTNNDMTGVLDTGIKIASGVATIKNSDISSGGTGVGILLTDGGDHVLGVDGDNNFKNVLKNLTTGLQVSITCLLYTSPSPRD